jgi:hypothetical protein
VSIDYLSFAAGFFLITDGILAMRRKTPVFFGNQINRLLRIALGLCILSIHAMQFFHYRIMSSEIAQIQINLVDYLAIMASVFLVTEGSIKILRSNSRLFPKTAARLFRVTIGSIVLTIHLLQFAHFSSTDTPLLFPQRVVAEERATETLPDIRPV